MRKLIKELKKYALVIDTIYYTDESKITKSLCLKKFIEKLSRTRKAEAEAEAEVYIEGIKQSQNFYERKKQIEELENKYKLKFLSLFDNYTIIVKLDIPSDIDKFINFLKNEINIEEVIKHREFRKVVFEKLLNKIA